MVVSNGDDCVSFKPNSTNMVVQNMRCTNSHGISVGSLGQYVGEVDIAGKLSDCDSACKKLTSSQRTCTSTMLQ